MTVSSLVQEVLWGTSFRLYVPDVRSVMIAYGDGLLPRTTAQQELTILQSTARGWTLTTFEQVQDRFFIMFTDRLTLRSQSLYQNCSLLYFLVAQFANAAEVVSQPDHSDYYSNQHQTQHTSARLLHHPTQ